MVVLECRRLCLVSALCARTVLPRLCAEGLAVRQGKVEAMGYEKQQNLMRNVANLRGLVRIKIEDNGDLALAMPFMTLQVMFASVSLGMMVLCNPSVTGGDSESVTGSVAGPSSDCRSCTTAPSYSSVAAV